ncbi:MAG: PAS domain S-box protein [Gemmatimonadetes bacterium]|nr:PAS domain S-box protein [Gemmatimonadota bacterium]
MLVTPPLATTDAHYRERFEQVGAVQLLLDPEQGVIVDANPAAAAFYGYPRETLRGMSVTRIETLPEEEVRQALLLAALVGGHYRGFPHRLASGDLRLVEIYAGPCHLDGRTLLYEIIHDVTEQIQLERARAEVEAGAQRLGAVAVGVAHEVRNPLFGISSTLDAFRARFGERPEFQPYLEVLGEQVERLSRLMRDLLEYGKPARTERVPGDLARVVTQALGGCRPVAEQHGVRLARTGPATGPAVRMDAARLQQLLQNLVENGVQHSPKDGQVLVAVEVRREAGEVTLTVSDEGPGFRAEDLPRVFEPFFTRRQGGTGLGLAIAQRVVAEHEGRLTAANGPAGGAHLTVTLPLLPG